MLFRSVLFALLAILTDNLDGYFARKYNQITELGKIIDPIADKTIIGTVAIIFFLKATIPLWFLIVVVGRDILILIGGLSVSKKIGKVTPSNYIGKATVLLISINFFLYIFNQNEIADYFMIITTLAIVISLISYVNIAIKKLGEANKS